MVEEPEFRVLSALAISTATGEGESPTCQGFAATVCDGDCRVPVDGDGVILGRRRPFPGLDPTPDSIVCPAAI